MNTRIEELFDQATFDKSRMVDGVYHPYIPLQFVGEPTRYSITREQYHKFAELIEANVIERIMTVGLINERGEVVTLGTSFRINE